MKSNNITPSEPLNSEDNPAYVAIYFTDTGCDGTEKIYPNDTNQVKFSVEVNGSEKTPLTSITIVDAATQNPLNSVIDGVSTIVNNEMWTYTNEPGGISSPEFYIYNYSLYCDKSMPIQTLSKSINAIANLEYIAPEKSWNSIEIDVDMSDPHKLKILSARIQPNCSYTFTFPDNITQHMVGIAGFNFAPNESQYICALSVTLHEQLAGNILMVTPIVNSEDRYGNSFITGGSYIEVVVIAWTDTITSNLLMTNSELTNIENSGESPLIDIPTKMPDGSSPPNPLLAALAGFNFYVDNKTISFGTLSAGVGTTTNLSSSSATVTGSATLFDLSGNNATTATVNGALLSDCDPDLPLCIIPTGNIQSLTPTYGSVSGSYTNAVALLSSFAIERNSKSTIESIQVNIDAFMKNEQEYGFSGQALVDGSGQDNSQSFVNGFVVLYNV